MKKGIKKLLSFRQEMHAFHIVEIFVARNDINCSSFKKEKRCLEDLATTYSPVS